MPTPRRTPDQVEASRNRRREYMLQWYKDNRERNRQKFREWCARNREHRKAYKTRWNKEHPESVRKSNKKQFENNREARREYGRKYHHDNKEKRSAYAKKYHPGHYAKNRDRLIAQTIKYARSHPEVRRRAYLNRVRNHPVRHRSQVKAGHARRKALARGAKVGDRLVSATISEWGRQPFFVCSYCCRVFPIKSLTVDHIVPLIKSGTHSCENISESCSSCNSRKHDKDLLMFIMEKGGKWS